MSADEAVSKDLIETLVDGKEGFLKGAEKLAETDRPEFAERFRALSSQRAEFVTQLRELARQYGDEVDNSGSVAATFHRGWMAIKDAVAGSDPDGVLDAAEQGENHAVSEYEDALDKEISPELRELVSRQAEQIRAARDEVRGMRSSH